jgi:hypothetical protein
LSDTAIEIATTLTPAMKNCDVDRSEETTLRWWLGGGTMPLARVARTTSY